MREDGEFDVEAYRHAIRVFITAMEIIVDLSSYPTERIARRSHDFRPLGLGYANLGTFLMLNGIPYDSSEGRAWAGALSAILSGHGYQTSAEIAGNVGTFDCFEENRESMLEVMNLHRDAAEVGRDGETILFAGTQQILGNTTNARIEGLEHPSAALIELDGPSIAATVAVRKTPEAKQLSQNPGSRTSGTLKI